MPPQPTVLSLVTGAPQARVAFAGLVAREPAALSVVASVTDGIITDPGRYPGARWWVGTDQAGAAVAAFMHTPPHPLHIALATEAQARDLAARLAAEHDVLPGVGGLRGPAVAFADEWVERTGLQARVAMEMGRFDLPVPPRLVFAVEGRFRAATGEDLALVDGWHQDFVDVIEGGGRAAPSLAEHVAAGRVGLWEVDGRPVSMAYASPANGGVTRISGVWTPPELRGHGYASGVVAALSTARLDAGEQCILYTDLANPTSNAIYEAIGYRRVGDSVHIAFSG
ncbi:MAG TPA: GNAT family N-acetyltransferase [Humibacillus xanthopallidus]|nr:GNAT family N-acetyltransferase [Humibacillus xanthopallidus]